ncbi:peptidoglycan D,D-transpeptidase FtsI family protein [Solibacillus sp. FSL H8-0538]|uniref:peptidoglycan D,D-transpeptidase FtsI family protein n=1 Tax=Solibacillus sp. FSL H8-0538 TaxID=2921400 RepID=UPI0030FC8BAC
MRKVSPQNRASNVKSKQRSSLTFRMNVLFFTIFVLFSLLIFRLGYLQIVKGEDYVRALERTEEVRVNTSVPRGRIFDRYGRVLVDNQPENAITYTKMQATKTEDMLIIAEQLAQLIDQPTKRVTHRDKLDFWIMKNKEAAYDKVTEDEMKEFRATDEEMEESTVNAELDRRVRERITEEELAQLTDFDIEVLAIYREMTSGYNLSPQIIKSENVTDEEFARVSERLADLAGVNTTTDWKRVRLSPLAILGRTTVPSKGVPKAKLNYYLARDYSRNDRVGESYFEAQYEEILQGEKSVVKNLTNKQGQVVETLTTYDGEPGKDLVSTIDIELQKEAERIVEEKLLELKSMGSSSLLDRAFYVMMNPNTGELLSVVGKKIEYDEETGKRYIVDYSYGTFTTAYEAGSTVKAATLLTGYSAGAITPGQSFVDEPVKLAGTVPKSSIFNRSGRIQLNDLTALERSSNVYMFKTAMAIAGQTYYYNMPFKIKDDTLQIMRNGYAQFGLGVPTGIDLPGEATGYQGILDNNGKILNLAIGQFDTYSTMQLAQYISTIANGGYRIQPRMLKEIRNPSTDGETIGSLVQEVTPTILNRISNSTEEIDHVKEGLRRVYFGSQGSAGSAFRNAPYTGAGKTGTAQVVYYGPQKDKYGTNTLNLVHVGFAPFENPEVAYAVMIPWATTNFEQYRSQANHIAREILDVYFDLQKKYADEGVSTSSVQQTMISPTTEKKLNEDEAVETINE